jgi:hypothetical protein
MAAQLLIFSEYIPQKAKKLTKKGTKKRDRYNDGILDYKKVYSLFQYDQVKYMLIWKKLKDLSLKLQKPSIFERVSPYDVLRLCYLKEDGEKIILGDQKHIYRYSTLYNIQAHIFNYSKSPLELTSANELQWERCGVHFFYDHYDGGFASIIGTEQLPIKYRVLLHLRLLRYLRQNKDLRKAVLLAKASFTKR